MVNSDEVVIKVDDVYKSFKVPHDRNSSLKAAVINLFKKKNFTQYDAAKGITFDVKKGEFLGIVGRNGCGKSTMLKMLAGIYLPNKGKITVNGRLSPFLELGVGFNPELSARDNVYLNGTILGMTRKEIDEKFNHIINFAELEEFVDQKLKNFSSGMQVRLAFSVAIQAHADILLIDEVLAVGDENFRRKCNNVFFDLKKSGKTIVFVSHDMAAIRKFCDRVLLFEQGKIYSEGDPEIVCNNYENLNLGSKKISSFSHKNGVVLETLSIMGNQKVVNEEEPIKFTFVVNNKTNKKLPLNIAFDITKDGVKVGGNSTSYGKSKGSAESVAPGKSEINISVGKGILLPGDYTLGYRLFAADPEHIYSRSMEALNFKVTGKKQFIGLVNLGEEIRITKA